MSFWVTLAFVLVFLCKEKRGRPSGDEREKATTAQTQRKQACQGPLLRSVLSFTGKETIVAAADWRKLIVSAMRKWRVHSPGPHELLLSSSRTWLAQLADAALIT